MEHVDCTIHLAGTYGHPALRDDLSKLPSFAKIKEYGYVDRAKVAEIFSRSDVGIMLFDRSPNHLYSSLNEEL